MQRRMVSCSEFIKIMQVEGHHYSLFIIKLILDFVTSFDHVDGPYGKYRKQQKFTHNVGKTSLRSFHILKAV